MGGFSLIHWIILGLFLLLLFGGNRFSNMMKDVANGKMTFKAGRADDADEMRQRYDEQRRAEPPRLPRDPDPIDVTARRDETAARPPRDDEAL
jgi:sec-independent protein translocase protein TatA